MKKSNILLVVLAFCLFVTPLIVWGIYSMGSASEMYTGFAGQKMILQIDNPALTADDVKINANPASGFPANELLQGKGSSYLYYEGSKKYLPEMSADGEHIYIKGAVKAPANEKLVLHVRINGIYRIVLNGEIMWEK